jgi:hypothetical protein
MTEFNPGGAADLDQAVKLRYEANPDTNAFTDAEKAKLAGLAEGANAYVHPDHSGDVLSASDGATTIAAGAVGNAKLAPMPAGTLKGRAGGGAGSAADLDAAAVRALLNVAEGATANASDAALRDRATHTGSQPQSSVTGLVGELAAKAPLDSPAFAGTPSAPTPAPGDQSGRLATTAFVAAAVATVGGGGGGAGDPLDLAESNPQVPPPGTVRLFREQIAGRQMPGFIGPSGLDSALQPMLARNKIAFWNPPGSATTVPGVFGFPALTTVGTATTRQVTTTNLFTRMKRLGYVSATTAGALASARFANSQFTTGDGAGLGGFFFVYRFGITAFTEDMRMFMGMRASTAAPTNVEPATLTNALGVGCGAADGNLHLYCAGSSAQAGVNLGADFPAKTANSDAYELALFAPPGSAGVVHYEVTRLNTGDTATGTISGAATVVPSATQLLAPFWGYVSNNTTAAAVGFDIASIYIETDY